MTIVVISDSSVNPSTAGVAYIQLFIFYLHNKYYILNKLKIKCDINKHYLKTVELKSE